VYQVPAVEQANFFFVYCLFEAKTPKSTDMLILGKGGNLSMEAFSQCPQIPSFKPQKGVPAEGRQA